MKLENYYRDKETGLVIRKINYDDPNDTFADIRVIGDWIELFPQAFTKHPLFALYWQIGVHERVNWLEDKFFMPGIGEAKLVTYAIIYNGTIISTPSVLIKGDEAYIFLGVKKGYITKYVECLSALIRYFKAMDISKVYYFWHEGIDKTILSKILRRFVINLPHRPDVEVWEVDT